MRGPALSVEVARELRERLRDAHVTTYNTLNTIFTGGLVAYLLRRVIETPAAERHWLLVMASLLTIIACWSGLFRMLALVRFPSRMSDALISFAAGGAGYVMVTMIQEGPRVWMQAAAAVAFFGGLGTLNMLRGGRSDPFNDMILPLIEADMKAVGYTRMGLAPALLAAAASPIPALVLEWLVVVGAVLALVADDVVWSRAVAHSTHPAALAAERGTTGAAPLD